MSFDQWRFVLSINLDTLFHTCKAVIPEMKKIIGEEYKSWRIISTYSAIGRAHVITSKSAVVGFSRALAMEYAEVVLLLILLCQD